MRKIHKNVQMNFRKLKRDEVNGRKEHEFLTVVKRNIKIYTFH